MSIGLRANVLRGRLWSARLHTSGSHAPRPIFSRHHNVPFSRQQCLTTSAPASQPRSQFSAFFTALFCVGVGTAAYGVYGIYTTMTIWPPEVADDLRAGLPAKHKGDLDLSERYLQRAWETAQTLPAESFKSQPHLKISGIAIALGEILEANGMPQKAYEVYSNAFAQLERLGQELSGPERLRAVAIACKLGEIAEEYHYPIEEEEKWLTWAVDEIVRMVKDSQGSLIDMGKQSRFSQDHEDSESRVVLAELDLPSWVSKTDVGAPLEALGAFYGRQGKLEYAMPLYLQAISLLIPPPPRKATTPEDRCRGAQLMNNLSELIMRGNPTPEKLHQAEAWSKQGLSIIVKTRETAGGQISTCEYALAAAYFNLGALREMTGDNQTARELFTASLEQSKVIGMEDGIVEAEHALQRLDALTDKSELSSVTPLESKQNA